MTSLGMDYAVQHEPLLTGPRKWGLYAVIVETGRKALIAQYRWGWQAKLAARAHRR